MAKFLNTSATNYFLEELIKDAKDRLLLISPFLKLNDKMRELLTDKNRLKIDVRIVYGKSELAPEEINWLKDLTYIRTSFCKNLHAKCYLNEEVAIITSLNLYEFSQVNNNEMGVLIRRSEDPELYKDTYEEAQRIMRISEEVRMFAEKVTEPVPQTPATQAPARTSNTHQPSKNEKLTGGKLAEKKDISKTELDDVLLMMGLFELKGGKLYLTQEGKNVGGEFKMGSYGPYFLWPDNLKIKYTTEQMSARQKMSIDKFNDKMRDLDFLKKSSFFSDFYEFTDSAKSLGCDMIKFNNKHVYLWPEDLKI